MKQTKAMGASLLQEYQGLEVTFDLSGEGEGRARSQRRF